MSDPTNSVLLDDDALWEMPDSEEQQADQPWDAHLRTNYGAYPDVCYACGNGLGIEEMDWNDGLCDGCQGILDEGGDPLDPDSEDDDDDWMPPDDTDPPHLTEDGVPLEQQRILDDLGDVEAEYRRYAKGR